MLGEQDITIKVTNQDGDTIELVTPYDSGANDWAQLFRTIMFWLTFSPSTIDDYIAPVDGWPEEEAAGQVGEDDDEKIV